MVAWQEGLPWTNCEFVQCPVVRATVHIKRKPQQSPITAACVRVNLRLGAGEDANSTLAEPLMALRDLAQDCWQTFKDLGPADLQREGITSALCSLLLDTLDVFLDDYIIKHVWRHWHGSPRSEK